MAVALDFKMSIVDFYLNGILGLATLEIEMKHIYSGQKLQSIIICDNFYLQLGFNIKVGFDYDIVLLMDMYTQ